MNAPLVKLEIPSLAMAEDELVSVMQNSVYPGAAVASIKLALGYCRSQNLDPMSKPVHIVPMKVKVKTTMPNGQVKTTTVTRDVIMPGIDLYRIKAARTGEHVGDEDAEWGPTIEEELGGEPKEEWNDQAQAYVKGTKTWERIKVRYAEWCQFTVLRFVNGEPRKYRSGRVYWKESYATAGNGTTLPNTMWLKRTFGQHEKCAEALALRRGFPEVGAQPTAEEMEGKTLEPGNVIDGATGALVPTSTQIPGPQAKRAEKPVPEKAAIEGEAHREEEPSEPQERESAEASAGEKGAAADDKPMPEGPLKILRAQMARAALSDADLIAKFGKVEDLKFSQFEPIKAWVAERASKLG